MKIKSVIFDLDGTLTAPMLDFDQIRKEMGLNPGSTDILAAINTMDSVQKKQAQAILESHELYAAENSQLNHGVLELLTALRLRNLPIGLLTRNTRENTMTVASRHQLTFDGIIDRRDSPAKPNGHGVLKLCRQFNAEPCETLVVGDFIHDMQSARDAGAIAVLLTTHPNAQEYRAHADYVIDSLLEVLDLIDRLEQN